MAKSEKSKTRLGTFDDLIEERTAGPDSAVAQIARRLREIVFEIQPDSVEVVRLGDKAGSYGVGPKKMSESHVYIGLYAKHVNLGFWYGVGLPDPVGLLEGSGKNLRHIKVRSLEEADNPAIVELIKAALAERKAALGLF